MFCVIVRKWKKKLVSRNLILYIKMFYSPIYLYHSIIICLLQHVVDFKLVKSMQSGPGLVYAQRPRSPDAQDPRCLGAQMPRSPDAHKLRCPDSHMPRSPDAQVPRCPEAQVPRCPDAQKPRCPEAQTPRRPEAQMPRYQ